MAIPPLVLRIYADSTGVKKGVAQAQAQVGGLRASVAQNAGLIKAGLIGGVAAGLAVATKAAGDLGEAQNAVNVTFGKSADVVQAWAKQAATSAGLAEAEALQAAAGFGAMLDSAGIAGDAAAEMSVKVAQLAGDVASLRNADPTEMLERMRAGLSGEAEPLRRFGVFISEARVKAEAYRSGIAKIGAELTDAQKIQARYNIILEDTQKAQGDFARTAGTSLPNQLRILRAQAINLAAAFGKILLPAVTLVLRGVNLVLGPLAKLAEMLGNIPAPAREAAAELVKLGLTQAEADKAVERVNERFQAQHGLLAGSARFSGGLSQELDKLVERQNEVAASAQRWAGAGQAAQARLDALTHRTDTAQGKIRRFRNVTTEDFNEWAKKAKENFNGVGTALDNLAGKTKLTADKIITEFKRQARNLDDYQENLRTVARRNIPDSVLQQLVDMGMGGADIIAELATASDRKFNQIVGAMKRTQTETKQTADQIEDLKGLLRDFPKLVTTTIRLNVDAPNAVGLEFGQRALGGPVQAGRLYRVNERGPEWFVPSTSGQVIPMGGQNSGAGGTPNVNVYIGEEKVEGVVVRALNKAGRR